MSALILPAFPGLIFLPPQVGWAHRRLLPPLTGYTDWEESDNLSLLRGRHSIKLGFDMHRKANNNASNFFGKGAYIFTPFFTGNAFADFLTGRATEIQQTLTPGTTGLRGQEYGAYIQDDFKVTTRLTLNLGLRYDLFPGAYEDYNRLSNLDPLTGVVELAGKNGAPRNFIPTRLPGLRSALRFRLCRDTGHRAAGRLWNLLRERQQLCQLHRRESALYAVLHAGESQL